MERELSSHEALDVVLRDAVVIEGGCFSFPLSVDSVMGRPFDIQEFREKVRQIATKT